MECSSVIHYTCDRYSRIEHQSNWRGIKNLNEATKRREKKARNEVNKIIDLKWRTVQGNITINLWDTVTRLFPLSLDSIKNSVTKD